MVRSKISAALICSAILVAPFCSAFADDPQYSRVKTFNLLPAQVNAKPVGAQFIPAVTAIRLGKKYGKGKSKTEAYCHITGKVGSLKAIYRTKYVKINNRRVRVKQLFYYVFTPLSAKTKSDKKALSALVQLCNFRIASIPKSSSAASSSSVAVESSANNSSAFSETGISSDGQSSAAQSSIGQSSIPQTSSAATSAVQSSLATSSVAQSSVAQSSAAQSSSQSSTAQSSSGQSSSSQSSVGTACPAAGFRALRNQADIVAMEANPSASYMLCNDITLSGEFVPMFNDAIRFSGIFDGGNHVLRGLVMSRPNDAGAALIMTTDQNSQVRNLIIENPMVEADLLASPLIGVNSGTITNVQVRGGTIISTRGWAGAVAGMSNSAPVGCSTTAEVLGFNTLGGLIGLLVPR